MNVFLITTDEPFHLPRMVDEILSHDQRRCIRGVALLQPPGRGGWRKLVRQFFDLYDFPTFLLVGAHFVASRIAALLPRAIIPRSWRSVADIASQHGLPIYRIADINAEPWVDFFHQQSADLLVSLSASQVFRDSILATPTLGVINVHGAPLPRYRGLLPSFWQLYHGETEGAVTVHWMEKKLDSGAILVQRSFPIAPDETLESLIRKGKALGATLVHEAIDLVAQYGRDVPTTPNDPRMATYFSFPTRQQAHEFLAMGRRFR